MKRPLGEPEHAICEVGASLPELSPALLWVNVTASTSVIAERVHES
jgi:hypothetical protein